MSHDRCARSCYFALCLPSVFSLCPALGGIPPPLSRSRRYSAAFCPAPCGIPLFLFCSRRYSGVLFSPAPCGIPQAITLPIQSLSDTPVVSSRVLYDVQHTRNTFRVADILLSCKDNRYCYVDNGSWCVIRFLRRGFFRHRHPKASDRFRQQSSAVWVAHIWLHRQGVELSEVIRHMSHRYRRRAYYREPNK